jgi:hypothetical protein
MESRRGRPESQITGTSAAAPAALSASSQLTDIEEKVLEKLATQAVILFISDTLRKTPKPNRKAEDKEIVRTRPCAY